MKYCIPFVILLMLAATSCPVNSRTKGELVLVDEVPVQDPSRPAAEHELPQGFNPDSPVGDLPQMPEEYQRGEFLTVIPLEARAWPNDEPFPPEFIEIINKLDAGEALTADDRITYEAFDNKWRNWDEIEAIGNSQMDE